MAQVQRQRARALAASNWGWEEGLTPKGHDGNFWSDRNFLCFDGGDGYMTLCLSKHIELSTTK